LASHGYAALALAYFDPTGALRGVPQTLSMIPLEYFGTAIGWLRRQPSVEPGRIAVWGASRGGELALLLGAHDQRIKAVVASAPSSVVWSGLPDFTRAAWSYRGEPVPFLVPKVGDGPTGYDWYLHALLDPDANPVATIPVENIHGPVLLVNGADDQLWPSQPMAAMIIRRLRAHHHPYRDEHLTYTGTGHVIPVPYVPVTLVVGPGIGGRARDTAHSGIDAWHQTLRFLHRTLHQRARGASGSQPSYARRQLT
jgi:dienelactone hydrolase